MIDIRRIAAGEGVGVTDEVAVRIPAGFGVSTEVQVVVSGRLTNIGKSFVLEGRGECRFLVGCSLCLEPLELPIDFHIIENYVEEEAEATEDDIIFFDKTIDIQPAVERGLFANVPMKPLCNPDCAGLCARCGANLNQGECDCGGEVNEQFRDLLRFFDKEEV
ncbi:MAG: DUF177 domain-containing protein [Defluviitaleaceae bacterium]|nr:DUF177 domain-containing protein [Defluviitaleaceae bacterium]